MAQQQPLMASILKSRTIWIALAVIVGLGVTKTLQIRSAISEHANQKMPPQGVTSFIVTPRTVETFANAVASLVPVQGAMLSAEEPGKITKINFESGSLVKAGDVLVQLDTAVEEAQLKSAEAKAQLGQVNLRRIKLLRPTNAASQSDLDAAQAQAQQADADAGAVRAQIARKTIVAPFSGQTGIRTVNPGDFVMQGKEIVPLQDVATMYGNFSLPQQMVPLVHVGQVVRLSSDGAPGEVFTGKITALDPQMSEATRNFKVQATFVNPNGKLRPGMFGTVNVVTGTKENVLAIPNAAVSYAPYGNSVFVIAKLDDGHGVTYDGVEQRIVQLGATRGDLVEVISGLKADDKIVSSGAFKLMPKMAIVEDNSVAPGSSAEPVVQDT